MQVGDSASATFFENQQLLLLLLLSVLIQDGVILIFVTRGWRIRHEDENANSWTRNLQVDARGRLDLQSDGCWSDLVDDPWCGRVGLAARPPETERWVTDKDHDPPTVKFAIKITD